MDILLAGPGTGKTTKVKKIIKEDYKITSRILVLSFTNATVNDLIESFTGFTNVKCYTLHSYALKINHLPLLHVLSDRNEINSVKFYADKLSISTSVMCSLLDCITYDDMIIKCIDFLKVNPAYATEKIGNLDLLIVDEYQDFNENERILVGIISLYANNTIILGDDDQSIYEFKDADPEGIIQLYNDTSINKLDHHHNCYRCPDKVVELCSKLISHNKNRIIKEWNKTGKPGNVYYKQCLTQYETISLIVNKVSEIKKIDPDGSFLILSPVRFYIDEVSAAFTTKGYSIINFWSEPIEKEDIIKIWWLKTIFTKNKLLFLLFLCKEYKLWSKPKFKRLFLESFKSSFDKDDLVKNIIDLNYLPTSLSSLVFKDITFDEFLKSNLDYRHFAPFIDEKELENSIKQIESKFKPELKFDKNSINLMSIHKSKGLQADYVFIYGLNEGVLPNVRKGIDTIEAQRRLLFVGMSRALKQLYLISTVEWDGKYIRRVDKKQFKYVRAKNIYYGRASRFISEFW